jgi:hypothetical protein
VSDETEKDGSSALEPAELEASPSEEMDAAEDAMQGNGPGNPYRIGRKRTRKPQRRRRM